MYADRLNELYGAVQFQLSIFQTLALLEVSSRLVILSV